LKNGVTHLLKKSHGKTSQLMPELVFIRLQMELRQHVSNIN
jgi:hypothetical protein